MNELINIAVVVMLLFGGTITAEKIYVEVRQAALTKSAQGLPKLSPFAIKLTNKSKLFTSKKLKQ